LSVLHVVSPLSDMKSVNAVLVEVDT